MAPSTSVLIILWQPAFALGLSGLFPGESVAPLNFFGKLFATKLLLSANR